MSSVTRTSLNSPEVQRFYLDRIGRHVPNFIKNLKKQKGSGIISDAVGGIVTNVVRAIKASNRPRRKRTQKKHQTGKGAKPPMSSGVRPNKRADNSKSTRAKKTRGVKRSTPIKKRGGRSTGSRVQTGKGGRRALRGSRKVTI